MRFFFQGPRASFPFTSAYFQYHLPSFFEQYSIFPAAVNRLISYSLFSVFRARNKMYDIMCLGRRCLPGAFRKFSNNSRSLWDSYSLFQGTNSGPKLEHAIPQLFRRDSLFVVRQIVSFSSFQKMIPIGMYQFACLFYRYRPCSIVCRLLPQH